MKFSISLIAFIGATSARYPLCGYDEDVAQPCRIGAFKREGGLLQGRMKCLPMIITPVQKSTILGSDPRPARFRSHGVKTLRSLRGILTESELAIQVRAALTGSYSGSFRSTIDFLVCFQLMTRAYRRLFPRINPGPPSFLLHLPVFGA
jgi:hypothetical protein